MEASIRSVFQRQNRLFVTFCGGFFLGWMAHLSRAEFLLPGFHNYLQVLSLFSFMSCAWLLWFRFRHQIPKLPMTNFKVAGIVCFTILMFASNFTYLFAYTKEFAGSVVKDLLPLTCILCGPALGIFSIRQRKILGAGFFVVLAVGVVTILTVNVQVVANAASRAQAFEEVGVALLYSFQVAVGTSSALLLLYFLTTVRASWLSVGCAGGMLFWLYTSIVYSKRQGLMEFMLIAGVLVLILMFGKRVRHIRAYMFSGIAICAVVAGFMVFKTDIISVMFDRVISRFSDIGRSGFENLDRIQEARAYFSEASVWRLLFGAGMGGFSFEIISMHTMHIGWANLVFKGGILMPVFYIWALTWNIVFVMRQPGFPNKFIIVFFSAFLMFRMLYSPAWGFLPSAIFLGLSFFAPEVFLASERQRMREEPMPYRPMGAPHPFRRQPVRVGL